MDLRPGGRAIPTDSSTSGQDPTAASFPEFKEAEVIRQTVGRFGREMGKMGDVEIPAKRLAGMRRSVAAAGLIMIALWLTVIVQCASLLLVTERYNYFNMYFDLSDPGFIILSIGIFLGFSVFFVFANFSFGYVIGFTFFIIVMDFVWLSHYSRLRYDHDLLAVVVIFSFSLLLLPALLFGRRTPRRFELSMPSFSLLLNGLILLVFVVLVAAAGYNFRIVGLNNIYQFREQIEFPTVLNYAINICVNAVAPFVFASLVERKNYLRALGMATLLLAFYPITLSKGALFAPFWLIAMAVAMHGGNPRFRIICLFLIMFSLGVVAAYTDMSAAFYYFGTVNFRLFAIPASVIEHHLEYFQFHPTTGFCTVGFLQKYLSCLNTELISVVLNKRYGLGNQNGSLFATEGAAAFGFYFMPVAALIAGALIGLGNAASNGLSARFVAVSGGMMPLVMNNVPLSVALVTGGYLVLLVLWAVTAKSGIENNTQELPMLVDGPVSSWN